MTHFMTWSWTLRLDQRFVQSVRRTHTLAPSTLSPTHHPSPHTHSPPIPSHTHSPPIPSHTHQVHNTTSCMLLPKPRGGTGNLLLRPQILCESLIRLLHHVLYGIMKHNCNRYFLYLSQIGRGKEREGGKKGPRHDQSADNAFQAPIKIDIQTTAYITTTSDSNHWHLKNL